MFQITPYTNRSAELFDPFRYFDSLDKHFFGKNALTSFSTDITDLGNAYQLEADLPGFDKENIKIELKEGYMTISAERHAKDEKKDKDNNVVYSERSFGSFKRSFDISGVNENEISAEYNDGVLKVTLPKQEKTVPEARRLEIK